MFTYHEKIVDLGQTLLLNGRHEMNRSEPGLKEAEVSGASQRDGEMLLRAPALKRGLLTWGTGGEWI